MTIIISSRIHPKSLITSGGFELFNLFDQIRLFIIELFIFRSFSMKSCQEFNQLILIFLLTYSSSILNCPDLIYNESLPKTKIKHLGKIFHHLENNWIMIMSSDFNCKNNYYNYMLLVHKLLLKYICMSKTIQSFYKKNGIVYIIKQVPIIFAKASYLAHSQLHTSKSIFVKFCTNINNKLLLYISCANWATTISDKGSVSAVPYNKFFITKSRYMEVWRCLERNNGDVRLRRSSVGWRARARVRHDGSGDTTITTTTTTDVTILMLLPLNSTRRMRSVGNLAPSANDTEDDYLFF
ncbi:hypothetical protein AGLY_012269, partial [Aphis glycines]